MNVILISGKAGHGKDTVAKFLKDALEADGKSVLITHYGDLVKYICKMFFNWNGEKDEKGRALLQKVGTDIVRTRYPDYWVSFIIDVLSFFPKEWDYVLVPDCRFQNEIGCIRRVGFNTTHLRVVRDGFVSLLTSEQQSHSSETDLDDVQPDYYIINDGSLKDLQNSVIEWLLEVNGMHQITFEEIQTQGG